MYIRLLFANYLAIGDASYAKGSIHDVVWFIRLPRLILAVGVGIGLSVCGTVMQAIVKNPLADPYVLGISSGAYLGAVIAIVLGIGSVLGGNFVGIIGIYRCICRFFWQYLLLQILVQEPIQRNCCCPVWR